MQLTYLLYNGIEPIDLGAIGVMSMGRRIVPQLSYRTVAATRAPVELSNGLRVLPDAAFEEVADIDVLMVPGGPGWRDAAKDPLTLNFIRRWAPTAMLSSLCTGAMILAAANALDGLVATTKCVVVPPETSPMDELKKTYPGISTTHALLVDNGRVVTGGGVALCIDTTLYLIGLRYGSDAADEVARIMEYGPARAANSSRLPLIAGEALADFH
ncbi:DJ-1/PfpI family protein [Rhodoferax sediminis]|uniref:DJ-1/PfpI family protein n=1 Tax=Rhodoferax sediminis TaxID=2509614 RepID=A0A515DA44_9BURK|nr:DJ-1/PfpI family protein [Rhodoferax sediminis]QDL37264.1 DJ-1/PfpI family protein [Rhodoferax sediminis]